MFFFYLLLWERPRKVNKSSPYLESYFAQGLPSDFMGHNTNQFGSVDKLESDMKFRYAKLEMRISHEKMVFEKAYDVQKKDKEAFQALEKQHQAARHEFHLKYKQAIIKYQNIKISEELKAKETGLR